MKKIFYTLFMLLSLSAMAQESVDLKVSYQKGDRYRSKMVEKSSSMLAPIKSRTFYQTATVKEVSANGYKLEIDIDRVVIEGNNNGKPIHYDSSVKELDASVKGLHSRYKSELYTVVAIAVNNKGKTLKKTKVKGLMPSASLCKTNLLELPNKPLAVGDEWDVGFSKNNMITAYVYTVTKITDTTISVALQGSQINEYTHKPQSFFDGTIELDKATGVPTKENINLYVGGAKKTKVAEVTVTTEKI